METWEWLRISSTEFVCDDWHVYHDGNEWHCESATGMIGFGYHRLLFAMEAASRTTGNGNGHHVTLGGWN